MCLDKYRIFLDDVQIGTTCFENADAPMGIVFGNTTFLNEEINYDWIKTYCKNKKLELSDDCPEQIILITNHISGLKIINSNGIEILGIASTIEGSDDDGFEIIILGIPHPFFEKEFSHHLNNYNV